MSTDHSYVPTALMVQDPRLRRLFALVGDSLAHDMLEREDELYDALLELAPEFVPPEGDEELDREWSALVWEAT